MYENKIITEPKWKSWIIQTTTPLFTPDQCRQIIECGRSQPPQKAQVGMNKRGGGTDTSKRVTTISWIPFKEMGHMYQDLNKFIQKANENHFGFGDIQVTENAQFTEYPEGGFYDWHMDCDVNMQHEPPVRKISMTLLLNDPRYCSYSFLCICATTWFTHTNFCCLWWLSSSTFYNLSTLIRCK